MAITKIPAAGFTGNNFRNIIINGDMSIAQRGTSTASISGVTNYYTVDRWNTQLAFAGTWTQSQETDVPTGQGFATSLKMDCTTANSSLSASSFLVIQSRFEGQNLQYLKKGTANAESLTLSFWVKSNKTGTYAAEIRDADNSRHISKTYTINSANTWEKKTITYAGDTTGAFDNDNAQSLRLLFWLAAGTDFTSGTLATSWQSQNNTDDAVGQVNLADSTANEWFITGIQLEAGTTASDFEFLPYDVNLRRCQRYFQTIADGDLAGNSSWGTAIQYTASIIYYANPLKVTMRTTPTLYQTTGTNYYNFYRNGAGDSFDSLTIANSNNNFLECYNDTEISGTAGQAGFVRTANGSAFIGVDAEL